MAVREAGWSGYGYLCTTQCVFAGVVTGAAVFLIGTCVKCWNSKNNYHRSDRETERGERHEVNDQTNERPNEELPNTESQSERDEEHAAVIKTLQQHLIEAESDKNQLRRSNRNLKDDLRKVKDENKRINKRLMELLTEGMELNTTNVLDFNNPKTLAETNMNIFDNEWMTAHERMHDSGLTENACRNKLLTILMKVHSYCHSQVHMHIQMLANKDRDAVKRLKHILKRNGDQFYQSLYQEFSVQFFEQLKQEMPWTSSTDEAVANYTKRCFKLCWFMAVQDPPIVYQYGPNGPADASSVQGQEFQQEFYREYKTAGKTIAFIVWPIMFQDTMLCKGVAEGNGSDE